MIKKNIISSTNNKILKLKAVAKEKESIRTKLAVTAEALRLKAKQLATVAKEKESVRTKLAVTAETLRFKAEELATVAEEKESARKELAITAKQLVVFAKEKESVRVKLEITAKQLATVAEEKESINKYLRTLLESIGDGVIVIDREWNITEWNQAASNITGWGKDEVLGKPLKLIVKFIHENDRTDNITFIEDAMVSGKVRNTKDHTLLIKKNGEEISVGDSSCSPIFDSSLKVIGAIIIFRDVSKENEATKMHSDFTYASHQLNTPVTKALWSLEVALNENDILKIKEKINTAYESIQGTLKLVGQLGIISTIDQKILIPQYENIHLVDTIDEIKKNLEKLAKEKNVVLNVEGISPLLGINTDPKMFSKILFEIIQNSIFYIKTNGKINLIAKVQDNNIIFEISDNGIGITEEQQPLIFTKFFRGNNFDTTQIIGAGVGLFVAKEYVKLLKGKIWFSSKKDEGTTFFVSLPLS